MVCDGSTDDTADCASAVVRPAPAASSLRENQGKGWRSVTASTTRWPSGRLAGRRPRYRPGGDHGGGSWLRARRRIDAVVGCQAPSDARGQLPLIRRVYSCGFQFLVRALFRINVRDTQVGAKLFRREMARHRGPAADRSSARRLDLEFLAVGADFGFDRIEETPIALDYRSPAAGSRTGGRPAHVRGHARDRVPDPPAPSVRPPLAALQRQRTDAAAREVPLEADQILTGLRHRPHRGR